MITYPSLRRIYGIIFSSICLEAARQRRSLRINKYVMKDENRILQYMIRITLAIGRYIQRSHVRGWSLYVTKAENRVQQYRIRGPLTYNDHCVYAATVYNDRLLEVALSYIEEYGFHPSLHIY